MYEPAIGVYCGFHHPRFFNQRLTQQQKDRALEIIGAFDTSKMEVQDYQNLAHQFRVAGINPGRDLTHLLQQRGLEVKAYHTAQITAVEPEAAAPKAVDLDDGALKKYIAKYDLRALSATDLAEFRRLLKDSGVSPYRLLRLL